MFWIIKTEQYAPKFSSELAAMAQTIQYLWFPVDQEDYHAASCYHGPFRFQEYMSASPLQEEEFHERGVRRLNGDEVLMPSGRILQATPTVSTAVL